MTSDTQTMILPGIEELLQEAIEVRKLTKREREWFRFVQSLEPWQYHRLLIVGEMELHDQFVSGETLAAIFEQISATGEENPYKPATEKL